MNYKFGDIVELTLNDKVMAIAILKCAGSVITGVWLNHLDGLDKKKVLYLFGKYKLNASDLKNRIDKSKNDIEKLNNNFMSTKVFFRRHVIPLLNGYNNSESLYIHGIVDTSKIKKLNYYRI